MTDPAGFIAANTRASAHPLVPEVTLALADELTPLWQATEAWLSREGVSPPYWAFAWPGSAALARWVLDDPAPVAGRRVLDFASGCGLAAIAAAKAGAASVLAADIDPLAEAAARLNAAANGVALAATTRDVVGEAGAWDVILAGVARQPFWEFPTSILGTLPCAPPRPSDVIETPLRRPCHYPPRWRGGGAVAPPPAGRARPGRAVTAG